MKHRTIPSGACLSYAWLITVLAFTGLASAAVPPPEKLLPDDTLVVLSAPDFFKLRAGWEKSAARGFWGDPAMRPFRENFMTKWNEQFVRPLERELDIKLEDYTSLLQGQVTVAITQPGLPGTGKDGGMLLLVDTRDQSPQLKKNLVALRQKWVHSGRPLKTVKVREFEFSVLPISSNDLPKTLRKFFPKPSEVHELGEENTPKPPEHEDQLVIGQVDSLLVLTSSMDLAEKIVARTAGGSIPVLADSAIYQADHAAYFREAPLYGWVNLKSVIEAMTRKFADRKESTEAGPNPFDVKPEKLLAAAGFTGLKTLAFSFQQANDGSVFQLALGVPESSRQGLFKIIAGEPRETRPPRFVPSDVVKFRRYRLDAQKAWNSLQKALGDFSPQWLSGINFLLDTANAAAREKDPGFDVRKDLLGNVGDDMISYQKALVASPAPGSSPPSLFLLGSPNAERLASSLKSILIFATQQPGAPPEEREFLGRKIYSVALKPMMVPLGTGSAPGVPRTLSYAASGGYVAFSSDPAMIEEYLRSSDGQRKPLEETPGLSQAAQRVIGPNSMLFGYENQATSMRILFDTLRKRGAASASSSGAAANLLQSNLNVPATVQGFKDLMDFSLLPDFDSVAKYFDFSVYGGSATVDGFSYKLFNPTPAGLKNR